MKSVPPRCDCDLLEFLWRSGAPAGEPNNHGVTPLRLAVRHNNRAMASLLISMGERLPEPPCE